MNQLRKVEIEMNLTKLFDMQRVLDQRIMDKHPELKGQDNLEWKVLALQVELGECANEHRGFKKWSNDQEPRIEEEVPCPVCNGTGDLNYQMVQEDAEGNGGHEYIDCEDCDCSGVSSVRNPLLEEYVDCLHFILSIGTELGFTNIKVWCISDNDTNTSQFLKCFDNINSLYFVYSIEGEVTKEMYERLFGTFIALGESLGFTWEQIEQAYFEKNEINHIRQEQGY
jgi:dimeric dUTPase (all-alpha-NTP-PPase superfamily)